MTAPAGRDFKVFTLAEALAAVDSALSGARLPARKTAVRRAAGRTLARDAASRLDLPPFDKSAVDGYAVLHGDAGPMFQLLGTVRAGEPCRFRLAPGAAVKVMTGAPVPEGTGCVAMTEYAEEKGDGVRLHARGRPGNFCRKGEDVRAGDVILAAGSRIGPVEHANLVACGVETVVASRQPRLAVLSTGDEIVDSPEALAPGRIMNSNGPMLARLGVRHGLELVSEALVPDDRQATAAALRAALGRADIVALSGGVSAGDFDFVLDALGDVGLRVHFARLALKPGRPTVFASNGSKAAFGLPGNPVAAYLTFHLFVLRAAARITGARREPEPVSLPLAARFHRRNAEREEFVPAVLRADAALEPIVLHGSAHLSALLRSDGFFSVPAGVSTVEPGEKVSFLLFRGAWD